MYNPEMPLIIQSDRTVLVEVDNPHYEEARDHLARFAELEKSPEHIHTYRITPLSLWNAAAAGLDSESILTGLERYSKYDIPQSISAEIRDLIRRYGRVKLVRLDDSPTGRLALTSDDAYIIEEIAHSRQISQHIDTRLDQKTLLIKPGHRGLVKQTLITYGMPVQDLAGYIPGSFLDIRLAPLTSDGRPFGLRDYQKEAVEIFYAGGSEEGGSGVIVLPCGAGKTVVGIGCMAALKCETLILATNTVAVRQWMDEILDKTNVTRDEIGEYTGQVKEIKPITVTTYQMLTYRPSAVGDFPHFAIFNEKNWGLIIYDEVHLLPAPVFRVTAEIQAKRRLGLTATLIREDGKEDEVFSLIGPKKYDVPWKDMESQGWIATAVCYELRVELPESLKMDYAIAEERDKFRIASENPKKLDVVKALVDRHKDEHILVVGQYISQLEALAKALNAPIITGRTSEREREKLYSEFKAGKIGVLVVSRVANFSVDLPDANVAIQVSGTFGSRQEEAQRLGRILRPKASGCQALFYTIVTRDSREQDFAAKRQMFLAEQGYKYAITSADEV